MFKSSLLALVVAAAATGGAAQAESKKGANGGMVVTSSGHPIELVLKDREVVFYLTDDDGSPMSTKGMRGRATIQDGGKTTTVELQPAAPNAMSGKLQSPLGAKARVVFSANFRAGSHTHTLTARYVTE